MARFTITIEGQLDSWGDDENGKNVPLEDFLDAVEKLAPYVFDNVVVTSEAEDTADRIESGTVVAI